MTVALNVVRELYEDASRCAEVAGLRYVQAGEAGIRRRRCGRGFSYRDAHGRPASDAVAERIARLAIPPAWRDVWICADENGHIQATGEDDRGRKQYLYHAHWRELRDLLNFYRLIVFGRQLPKIRAHVEAQLRRRTLDRERVLAAMLRIIDSSAVRIGNDVYADDNDSFGLTTLTKRHARVQGARVEFSFPGKSGRRIRLALDDRRVARVVADLQRQRGRRLFAVYGKPIDSADVNACLVDITGEHISAKDFRTWTGTLTAFCHLRDRRDDPQRATIEALDRAADQLGNTRAVARAHYVHPHMLDTVEKGTFEDYLQACSVRRREHLDTEECALLAFLELLMEREFDQVR